MTAPKGARTYVPVPGDRIRVNDTCCWPERRGLLGWIVEPRGDGYPTPAAWEVIVLVEDDPLITHNDWWTCVMSKTMVDPA